MPGSVAPSGWSHLGRVDDIHQHAFLLLSRCLSACVECQDDESTGRVPFAHPRLVPPTPSPPRLFARAFLLTDVKLAPAALLMIFHYICRSSSHCPAACFHVLPVQNCAMKVAAIWRSSPYSSHRLFRSHNTTTATLLLFGVSCRPHPTLLWLTGDKFVTKTIDDRT